MYRLLFDLVFRRIDAETAHRIGFALIRLGGVLPGLARLFGSPDPVLRTRIWDLDLPGPLGLAAGFDKDGHGPAALGALGFAFVEVGTVTAVAQPGNPRPRLFRLPADRAVVNRMGFNNGGAAALGARLAGRRDRTVVGVNIGKTKAVAEADAVADYEASTGAVAAVADYLVVNVSSPNTPGLRDLQAVDQLRPLLVAVRARLDATAPRRVPLLVKIAPDLADEDVDAVADLAVELGLDGIIATNTTISRDALTSDPAAVSALGAGGLSGAPLAERSLAVLRRLRERVGDRVPLVAVGGVRTGADAYARIRAGAVLVQGYTAFIYGGPLWPRRVQRELARLLRRDGFTSIGDAVGADIYG